MAIRINDYTFDVYVEHDQSLWFDPIHFIYYKNDRVGLYVIPGIADTIYFDSITMFKLFGQEFNADNFSIGITFGRFDRAGLTNEQYNKRKNETDRLLKRGDDLFKDFALKEEYKRNNIK